MVALRWWPTPISKGLTRTIHEGGELGYAVAHAYGAAFDNADLIVACVVGDGEVETGPLTASWHGNKFLNQLQTEPFCPFCISTVTKLPIPQSSAGCRTMKLSSCF